MFERIKEKLREWHAELSNWWFKQSIPKPNVRYEIDFKTCKRFGNKYHVSEILNDTFGAGGHTIPIELCPLCGTAWCLDG